jgi:hypothetical protein
METMRIWWYPYVLPLLFIGFVILCGFIRSCMRRHCWEDLCDDSCSGWCDDNCDECENNFYEEPITVFGYFYAHVLFAYVLTDLIFIGFYKDQTLMIVKLVVNILLFAFFVVYRQIIG